MRTNNHSSIVPNYQPSSAIPRKPRSLLPSRAQPQLVLKRQASVTFPTRRFLVSAKVTLCCAAAHLRRLSICGVAEALPDLCPRQREALRARRAHARFATAKHIDRYTIHAYKLWTPRNGVNGGLCEGQREDFKTSTAGGKVRLSLHRASAATRPHFCWHSCRCRQARPQRGVGFSTFRERDQRLISTCS